MQDTSENTQESPEDVMIVEELVYPYDMTMDMLDQYKTFSGLNLTQDMTVIFRKLFRSARYWRVEPKQYAWLVNRMR